MDRKGSNPDGNNTNPFACSIYDLMFNFTQDAVAIFDTKLNVLKSNGPFAKIVKDYLPGLDPDKCNIFDLIPEESDRKDFLSVINGEILMGEITLNSPDIKKTSILQTKLGPIKDNGEIIGGYAIFADITKFRKKEDELNRRFKLICQLVENANLGIVIIGQDHKVIEANQRFCEMLGYSHNEITELHTWDWENIMDKGSIQREFCDLSETNSTFDTVHRRKDGTTYFVTVSASGCDAFGDGNDVIMCICRDITEKKQMEEKLRLSEQKLTNYLGNAADMIFTVDAEGIIKYISPNCVKICGFKPEYFMGEKTSNFFIYGYPEHGKNRDPFTTVSASDSKSTYHTFRMQHKDGTAHWYGVTISKTLEENGNLLLICNARNIDKNIEKERRLEQLSLYDHLTGVANKAFFDAMLKSSQTNGQRPLSILVCDMDQLKAINDRYGHARGDEAIKITAQLIRSSLRKADFIARIGGDEFAVILPGAGRDEAMAVMQRIHKSFAEYNSGKKGPPFTISAGMSTVNDTETSLEAALYSADMDMYRRKHAH